MISWIDHERVTGMMRPFGCTPRETDIYLHLLQTGPSSVQMIARSLKQNRVTVHSAVDQLIDKGFLFESRKGKRRLLAAEDPDVFRRLLSKRQSELNLLAPGVDQIAQMLSGIRKTDQSVPTVKFYEGIDGLKKMLDETLSSTGEVLVFTYVDLFSKLLSPKYLENYYIRRAKRGISTRLIFPHGEFGKKVNARAKEYNMRIRFLSKGIQWRSGIFAWNNIVAIQSFTEGKVTCTVIENEDIAYFYRHVIYEMCWQQAMEESHI